MAEAFVGEIRAVGFSYAPAGWALCNGAMLEVRDYAALFSLLSNRYGGDGQNTFKLPNLNGRTIVGVGQGSSMTHNYQWGEMVGNESTTLSMANLAPHTHTIGTNGNGVPLNIYNAIGNQDSVDASTKSLAISGTSGRTPILTSNTFSTSNPNAQISNAVAVPEITGITGSGTAFSNVQPSIALYYIICLEGIYPQRP